MVDQGNEVAVVVSAMSGVTNQLVSYVDQTSAIYDAREYDTILSSGEQITAGLMALQLQKMGINSRSWLGWQIPIRTDDIHGKARIMDIDCKMMIERFSEGQVAGLRWFSRNKPT